MVFGLIPKILNPINMIFLIRKQFCMVNAIMLKVRNIKHVIPPPAVQINDAIGNYFVFDYEKQRRRRGILDDLFIDAPPRLSSPNTGILPAAPRPRFPLRTPPK